jgi:hypothetical protein
MVGYELHSIMFQGILAVEQLRNCLRGKNRLIGRDCEGRYDQRTF